MAVTLILRGGLFGEDIFSNPCPKRLLPLIGEGRTGLPSWVEDGFLTSLFGEEVSQTKGLAKTLVLELADTLC